MKEVVINQCFGGFGLSEEGMKLYHEKGGQERYCHRMRRTDPILIEVVKELGEKANKEYSNLSVEEIEDGYNYYISEYDGVESIQMMVNEDNLRELLKEGDEDKIVEYVMKCFK